MLESLQQMAEVLKAFPKYPPYYRCHPETMNAIRGYFQKSDSRHPLLRFRFDAVEIREDADVPPGEFRPPVGWVEE